MKKIFVIFLFICILMTICIICNKQVYNANNSSTKTYCVRVYNSDESIDYSNIRLNFYEQKEIVDNDDLSITEFYDKFSFSSYVDNNGFYFFDTDINNYSVSIDLTTLPSGYGVIYKNMYLSDNNKYVEFILLPIFDVEFEFDGDYEYSVRFYSPNYKELYANYEIKCQFDSINTEFYFDSINYHVTIFNNDKEFLINDSYSLKELTIEEKNVFLHKYNLINNAEISNLDDSIQSESILFNQQVISTAEVEDNVMQKIKIFDNFFRISYELYLDENSSEINQKIETLVENIGQYFINVDDFYIDVLNFERPLTNDENYYDIKLNFNENATSKINRYMFGGTTNPSNYIIVNNKSVRKSEIEIEIECPIDNNLFLSYVQEYLHSICAHEYFHAISYSSGVGPDCILESTACFMDLYYISIYLGINNFLVRDNTKHRINDSFLTSFDELLGTSANDSVYNYGLMLFNIFLYEKFDNINFIKFIIENEDYYNTYKMLAIENNTTFENLLEEFAIYRTCPNKFVKCINSYYTEKWKIGLDHPDNLIHPTTLKKYSRIYYVPNLTNLDNNTSIYITIDIQQDLTDEFVIYTIKNYENKESVVKKMVLTESRITIKLETIDISENEEFFIVFANLSDSDIKNGYIVNQTNNTTPTRQMLSLSTNTDIDIEMTSVDYSKMFLVDVTHIGMYQIKLEFNNFELCDLPKGVIEFYDSSMNLILKKSNISGEYAQNKEGENSIIVDLDGTRGGNWVLENPYYLRIAYIDTDEVYNLKIKRIKQEASVVDTKVLNNLLELNNFSGDQFSYYNCEFKMNLKVTFTINELNSNEKQDIYILKKRDTELNVENLDHYVLTKDENSLTVIINTSYLEDIIFLYFGGNNQKDLIVYYELLVHNDFNVILDPIGVHPSAIGSEVTLNDGMRGGVTITKGFTRCAYLSNDAPSNSRLNYEWVSSDSSVATVSSYGTILGIKPGTAIIMAKYIDGRIGCIVVEILEDTETETVTFTITTDLRADSLVGTYVSSGLGTAGETDLKVGYTRLISLASDAPVNVIQNYIWTSSDPSIADISSYGTITANKVGTVVITGVYKYNNRYVAYITITIT